MSKPTFVDDYALITTTLNKYNDGVAQASSAVMKPAFAKQATMFSVADGKLSGGPIEGLFTGIDADFQPSPDARVAIARVDIVGDAASARVDTNDASGFLLFGPLPPTEGRWLVDHRQQDLPHPRLSLRLRLRLRLG